MAERMRASLGQPIMVENVTGAGGTIGVGRVARAAPDGYTIGIGHWGTHVRQRRDLSAPIRSAEGFRADRADRDQPILIVAKKAVPANDFKELIAWLKANPDKVVAGHRRRRHPRHVGGSLFQNATGAASSSCRIAAPARPCRTWSPGRST